MAGRRNVDSSLRAMAGRTEGFSRFAVGGAHGPVHHVTSLSAKGEKDNEDHNLWFLLLLVRFYPSLLLLYSNSFRHTHRFEFRPTEDDHDDAPGDGISLSSSTLCFSSAFSCS
ncbi:hypothetical protein L1887_13622 [Cichorium endivia]|nr:hypothetical protein L1887_13622 [Cichorium endivia]